MQPSQIREYTVGARSTDTFGRVLCNAREHHFVIDGPAQNGCPGEAVTPVEMFLASIGACGVELVQVVAREQGLPVPKIELTIDGMIDRSKPVRTDFTVLNQVRLRFRIGGVAQREAEDLVERFKGR